MSDIASREQLASDQPVRFLPGESADLPPSPGIALCLSGGGYRAMIFHLGALLRLNEVGLLQKIIRVSSVSGGSITAGMLGLKWKRLTFDSAGISTNLNVEVIDPIYQFASVSFDIDAVLEGVINPLRSIPDEVASVYRKHLFGHATLQDLPADSEGPRFVINATNVQTKVLWRFSKPYMGDYRLGLIRNPTTELAVAVGASSAFPPVLSPVRLRLNPADFGRVKGVDISDDRFRSEVYLSDGGVYDNLGLETAWKQYDTILVSDGGGLAGDEVQPHSDWLRHTRRVLEVIDNQVGALRKRQIVDAYIDKKRKGAYWGVRTDISHYGLPDTLPCPYEKTLALANLATRLKKMDDLTRQHLINWGYAVTDAALRKHVDSSIPKAAAFPYPQVGVG